MNPFQSFGNQAGDASLSLPARHFSDTRTAEGRVRFLLLGQAAELQAEGQGWQHRSLHPSLPDAANYLATLPSVSQSLYLAALDELERRLRLEQAA